MSLETDIPSWVEAVLEGDNKSIAKSLKIDLKEQQIFVFSKFWKTSSYDLGEWLLPLFYSFFLEF